jgi:3-oxoacyl-[acyl-carrier-protein] synthase II
VDNVVITGLGVAVAGVDGPVGLLRDRAVSTSDEDPVRTLTGRGHRYKDRATRLGLCAARDALADAGAPGEPDRNGVVVSSLFGNVDTVCDTVDRIAAETYLGTSPATLPNAASNVIASWIAIEHDLRGPSLTVCDGDGSGLDAVYLAALLLRGDRADRVLVVGAEPDNPAVRALTGGPTVDGAAALVLERGEVAAARTARVRAVLGGYARRVTVDDAVDVLAPTEVGLRCGPGHHDLTARLGDCGGALGVLQCVAGAGWLDGEGHGTVLATAGTAALVLTAGGAR